MSDNGIISESSLWDDKINRRKSDKNCGADSNDMDMRLHIMRSLGLKILPPIRPDSIDESSGIIAKTVLLKNFNFEELLYNDRHDYSRFDR